MSLIRPLVRYQLWTGDQNFSQRNTDRLTSKTMVVNSEKMSCTYKCHVSGHHMNEFLFTIPRMMHRCVFEKGKLFCFIRNKNVRNRWRKWNLCFIMCWLHEALESDKQTGNTLRKCVLLISRRWGKVQGIVRKALLETSSSQSSQQPNKPGF